MLHEHTAQEKVISIVTLKERLMNKVMKKALQQRVNCFPELVSEAHA